MFTAETVLRYVLQKKPCVAEIFFHQEDATQTKSWPGTWTWKKEIQITSQR